MLCNILYFNKRIRVFFCIEVYNIITKKKKEKLLIEFLKDTLKQDPILDSKYNCEN